MLYVLLTSLLHVCLYLLYFHTKYHLAGPNNILEKMYLEALCQTQITPYGCAFSVIQFQHYSEYQVELEKAPSKGL